MLRSLVNARRQITQEFQGSIRCRREFILRLSNIDLIHSFISTIDYVIHNIVCWVAWSMLLWSIFVTAGVAFDDAPFRHFWRSRWIFCTGRLLHLFESAQ